MIINTNISSLTAQEAAKNINNALTSSLEKLSTGLRINKASDDASGLAIADKLRTQATSINQGIANGNSAVTLLQIADKSMAEQSNILDTIKAKLIQANTDTTSTEGRESIRKDINKLLEQLDNIAEQTNYNGNTLLQESSTSQYFSSKLSFQVGESSNDIIGNTSIKANTQGLGSAVAEVHTASIKAPPSEDTEYTFNINGLKAATYTSVQGDTIEDIHAGLKASFEADTNIIGANYIISAQASPASSDFIITAKQSNTSFDLVEVTGSGTQLNPTSTTAASVWNSGDSNSLATNTTNEDISLSIDGYDPVTYTNPSTGINDFNVLSLIIAFSGSDLEAAGYTLDSGSSTGVKLTGPEGVSTASPAGFEIKVNGTSVANASPVDAVQESFTYTFPTAVSNAVYSVQVGDAFVYYTAKSDGSDTVATINSELKTLIEANETLSEQFEVSDGSTLILTNKLYGLDAQDPVVKTQAGNPNLSSVESIPAGTKPSLAELKKLTELTKSDSASFQEVVDDAITDLNAYRGDLGSLQNQVQSAVRNLMTQFTNVKAAESIIRDVDYAQESANFNKLNIISQAGSYAISQSNAIQQNVLKLLQ